MLRFIRSSANSFFNCHNPKGIKFITSLRLGLSHLRERKFKQGLNIESIAQYLLCCPTYITEKRTLLNTTENIDNNLIDLCEPVLIKTLLWDALCILQTNNMLTRN